MGERQRPRNRLGATNKRRVPLTYYRAANQEPDVQRSPFTRRVDTTGKGHKVFFATLDIIVIAAVIFGIFYSLMVRPDPVVKADDTSYHQVGVYQEAAARLLGDAKNRTKITFSEASVTRPLQKQFPEISAARVELPLVGQRPILRLSIAKPVLRLSGDNGSYVIDGQGTAVARSVDLPQVKGLPVIDDQSSFEIKPGQAALSTASIQFIQTLLSQCRANHVPIKSLTLPAAPLELDLRTKDQHYFVKFYLDGDAGVQTGQFLAARDQFNKDKSGPAQYLDVRVNGKVFYK